MLDQAIGYLASPEEVKDRLGIDGPTFDFLKVRILVTRDFFLTSPGQCT